MTDFDATLTARVAELLHREAYHLDHRDWDGWLALYTEDAVLWAPALDGDDGFTTDPDTEISLIYLDRAGIEARVFRIESGESYANMPLPMTVHLVTNIRVIDAADEWISVAATWSVRSFRRIEPPITRAGLYDYGLRREADGLMIAKKTVRVLDDRIIGPIDIFNI